MLRSQDILKTKIYDMVVGDGFNLMLALIIIKNKSNFILFFQTTADSFHPTAFLILTYICVQTGIFLKYTRILFAVEPYIYLQK
jgi:hypothetical protein